MKLKTAEDVVVGQIWRGRSPRDAARAVMVCGLQGDDHCWARPVSGGRISRMKIETLREKYALSREAGPLLSIEDAIKRSRWAEGHRLPGMTDSWLGDGTGYGFVVTAMESGGKVVGSGTFRLHAHVGQLTQAQADLACAMARRSSPGVRR